MVEKSTKNPIQVEFDGIIFTLDKKSGYYLSAKPVNGERRELLHRYVYSKFNGEIPKGYDVHHKDKDKNNNSIENLEIIKRHEHTSMHSKERIYSNYDEEVAKFLERTQEKAKIWHSSNDGKEWHSKHAYESIVMAVTKKDFMARCSVCGKWFETSSAFADKAMYCSKNCKAKARRKRGVDNVEKTCIICGKKFTSNKYNKTLTCGKSCGAKFGRLKKAGVSINEICKNQVN